MQLPHFFISLEKYKLMKKNHLLFTAMIVFVFILVDTTKVNSHVNYPDPGNCGDPVTNVTCAQSGCHPSPSQAATANDFTLSIGTATPSIPLNSSFKYAPNTTYNIALLLNAFLSNPYYGFQITALDASNQKAGSFTVSNAATTKITTAGVYEYMGHLNGNSTHNWVFKWTSPAASTGPVSFYFAFNEASIASPPPTVPEGTIYTGNVTIQPNTTGINDLSETISGIKIFPNPVTNELGLSLTMKENATVQAGLYSLDGRLTNELLNQSVNEGIADFIFNTGSLTSGIYLMKVAVGDKFITKKIFRQ